MFQTRVAASLNHRAVYASLLLHALLVGTLWRTSLISVSMTNPNSIQIVYAADWQPVNMPANDAGVNRALTLHAALNPVEKPVTPVELPREIPREIAVLTEMDPGSELSEDAVQDRVKSLAALISENGIGSQPEILEPAPVPDPDKAAKDEARSAEAAAPPVRIGGQLQDRKSVV